MRPPGGEDVDRDCDDLTPPPLMFTPPAAARAINWARDRAWSIRLDRAAAAFALGDELRARQWINDAAAAVGIDEPWPELGRPAQAHRVD